MLEKKIQPHDTGHIHTTISTLENRVKEIQNEILFYAGMEKNEQGLSSFHKKATKKLRERGQEQLSEDALVDIE